MNSKDVMCEIEDICHGLKNYPELRPTQKRINALEEINKKFDDKNIIDMINIFKEGHGILSKPERIKSLNKITKSK